MVTQQVQKESDEKKSGKHPIVAVHDLLMRELAAVNERLPIYTKVRCYRAIAYLY